MSEHILQRILKRAGITGAAVSPNADHYTAIIHLNQFIARKIGTLKEVQNLLEEKGITVSDMPDSQVRLSVSLLMPLALVAEYGPPTMMTTIMEYAKVAPIVVTPAAQNGSGNNGQHTDDVLERLEKGNAPVENVDVLADKSLSDVSQDESELTAKKEEALELFKATVKKHGLKLGTFVHKDKVRHLKCVLMNGDWAEVNRTLEAFKASGLVFEVGLPRSFKDPTGRRLYFLNPGFTPEVREDWRKRQKGKSGEGSGKSKPSVPSLVPAATLKKADAPQVPPPTVPAASVPSSAPPSDITDIKQQLGELTRLVSMMLQKDALALKIVEGLVKKGVAFFDSEKPILVRDCERGMVTEVNEVLPAIIAGHIEELLK